MAWWDSSSNSQTDAEQVGSQSGEAAASSLNIGDSKGVTVAINQTDSGLVSRGLDAVERISDGANRVAEEGLYTGERIADQSFKGINNILNGAAGLVRDAFRESSYQQENALQVAESGLATGAAMGRDAIDSNTEIASDAILFADDTVKGNQVFTLEMLTESLDGMGAVSSEAMALTSQLNESRSEETQQALSSVSELAETVQTGGENIQAKANQVMVAMAFTVAGFIAWRALQ